MVVYIPLNKPLFSWQLEALWSIDSRNKALIYILYCNLYIVFIYVFAWKSEKYYPVAKCGYYLNTINWLTLQYLAPEMVFWYAGDNIIPKGVSEYWMPNATS